MKPARFGPIFFFDTFIPIAQYGKWSKILNTSCQPRKPRQTVQTKIRSPVADPEGVQGVHLTPPPLLQNCLPPFENNADPNQMASDSESHG